MMHVRVMALDFQVKRHINVRYRQRERERVKVGEEFEVILAYEMAMFIYRNARRTTGLPKCCCGGEALPMLMSKILRWRRP